MDLFSSIKDDALMLIPAADAQYGRLLSVKLVECLRNLLFAGKV